MPMLTVAVDYDDTITADADLWRQVIAMFKSRGWVVVIVTDRRQTFDNRREIEQCVQGVPIYFAYDQPKRDYMESLGINVDIWIDDTPDMIVGDLSGEVSRLQRTIEAMKYAHGVLAERLVAAEKAED
jgi:hypothetical protein